MEKKTIGSFIAVLRKANGLTQKDLADRINVSDKTVSRWERNEGTPDLAMIPTLAEIFGVTTDELLRGERRPAGMQRYGGGGGGVCSGSGSGNGSGSGDGSDEEGSEGEGGTAGAAGAAGGWERRDAKTAKQRKTLLTRSLASFKNFSLISTVTVCLGLVGAMICNFVFLRAYLAFFVALPLILVGVVCQIIFTNKALLAVSDEDLVGDDVTKYRKSVLKVSAAVFTFAVCILAVCIPFIVLPGGSHWGLQLGSWLSNAVVPAAVSLILCLIVWDAAKALMVRRGLYPAEGDEATFRLNKKLKAMCSVALSGLLVLTLLTQCALTRLWDYKNFGETAVLDDYKSLRSLMETQQPHIEYGDGGERFERYQNLDLTKPDPHPDKIGVPGSTFSRETGKARLAPWDISLGSIADRFSGINGSATEALDGSENDGGNWPEYYAITGDEKLYGGFRWLNQGIVELAFGKEEVFPAKAYSRDFIYSVQKKIMTFNRIFAVMYAMEIIGVISFYRFKRGKYAKGKA